MNKLLRYNLSLLLSRWVIYVTPVVSLVAIIVANLLFKKSGSNFMLNNPWIVYTLLFFFSVVFVIQSTLLIFQSPKEDMTNSLVFSRAFSKKKIFFSQVVTNLIAIVIYSLFAFLSYFIIALCYEDKSAFEDFKFGISIFIGSIGIMTVFASLVSLTTLFLSSSWISFIWTILAIFIPLGSFVSNFYLNKTFSAVSNAKYISLQEDSKDVDEIYLDSRGFNNNSQARAYEDIKDNPYYSLAWIDPWYQLSGLYSLFDSRVNEKDARWTAEKERLNSSLKLNLNNKEISVLIRQTPEIQTEQDHLNTFRVSKVLSDLVKANEIEISTLTFERQLLLFKKALDKADENQISNNFLSDLNSVKTTSSDSITYEVDYYSIQLWNHFKDLFKTTTTDFDLNTMLSQKYSSNFILVPTDLEVSQFVKHPIIEKKYIALIWVGIMLLTSGAGITIFIKKDN